MTSLKRVGDKIAVVESATEEPIQVFASREAAERGAMEWGQRLLQWAEKARQR